MEIVTWDPNFKGNSCSLSNNNLTGTIASGATNFIRATHGIDLGKSCFEITFTGNAIRTTIGISSEGTYTIYDANNVPYGSGFTGPGYSFGYTNFTGLIIYYMDKYIEPYLDVRVATGIPFFINGDTIGICLDFIKQQILVYKNGVLVYTQQEGHLCLKKQYPTIWADEFGKGITNCLANFGATPFKYPIPDGFISLQDAVNIPPYKKLYKKGESVYGVQNDIFTKLSDDFSALSESEKITIFTNTDNRYPAIEELSSLGKFKVLTYSDTSTPPPRWSN